MKIAGYYHAILFNDTTIMLKPSDSRDLINIRRLFSDKKQREERNKSEILVNVSLDVPFHKRTIKEINTAFKLIDCIFYSNEGRKATEAEKMDYYYNLLDEYAVKVPSKLFPDRLRPIHLSEADSKQAATFIDGLLFHLCTCCQLQQDTEADVRQIIYEWETWRGQQKQDFTADMTERQWRQRAVYSEASGKTERLDLHHMITKGSNEKLRNCPENWMALTRDEHTFFHDKGEKEFLKEYPHLQGRFDHVHELALKAFNEE